MHILLIHQAFVSPTESGGTRHYELAQHLLSRGHKFSVISSNLNYLSGEKSIVNNMLDAKMGFGEIKIFRSYTYPAMHRSFFWRVISFLSFMVSSFFAGLKAGPVDLIIGTSPPIFQAVSAWLISFFRKRPFLLEIRDLWPDFAIDMGVLTNPILIKLSRRLEHFLYAQADLILVNSPAYSEIIYKKGIFKEKISLIANGVEPSLFDPRCKREEIRNKFGLEDSFVVTYAGALGMANDIQTVLRAANRLRGYNNIKFLIVGDGKERKNLEKMMQEMKIENVIFAGSRPKTDMPMILAASDACLAILMDIPMFRNTYPNKVFDYMAAQKPTILAIDGVIREVIEAAGGGLFVPPGNDEALAEVVLKLASNPELVYEMGSAARSYVVRHFNRSDQAQEFVDMVTRLGKRYHFD